jgi:hypothetical protein
VGCGQFYFYVTQPGAPALALASTPRLSRMAGPIPLILEGAVPGGWTDVAGRVTAIMSGYILEEVDLAIDGGRFRYAFDPWRLHDDYPNLDVRTGPDTAGLVDTFTISLMLTGVDGGGVAQEQAVSVVLQGQDVLALAHSALPAARVYLPVVLRTQ